MLSGTTLGSRLHRDRPLGGCYTVNCNRITKPSRLRITRVLPVGATFPWRIDHDLPLTRAHTQRVGSIGPKLGIRPALSVNLPRMYVSTGNEISTRVCDRAADCLGCLTQVYSTKILFSGTIVLMLKLWTEIGSIPLK